MITKEAIKEGFESYRRVELGLTDFPGFRRAGVLVPLFPQESNLHVLLTLRTESVETHKGQISFPGGMMDETDKDVIETALREAREEIGLEAAGVEILGLLDDVPVPSQFLITPVVGYFMSPPRSKPNELEVKEVLEVPLIFFADERNARSEERELRGRRILLWFYDYNGRTIWGATASILRNLVKLSAPAH